MLSIDHGTSGPLHLSYAKVWEKNIADIFTAAAQVRLGNNLDVNSGNPIGMGMGAACLYEGKRTTASSYLRSPPQNLTIITDSPIAKILLDSSSKKATGALTISGVIYRASKEVILSAGALNTPQILMLSGIGPASELQKHSIEQLHDLPQVGQNLQDHCFAPVTILLKPGSNDRAAFACDEAAMTAAKEQLAKDGTGPLASLYCSTPMGWFKDSNVLNSSEFAELPQDIQRQLSKPTVPIFEIATVSATSHFIFKTNEAKHVPPLFLGDHTPGPEDTFLTALAFGQNPQSVGTVTLASSNLADAPLIDPQLLKHPFDRRVAIEAMRRTMDLLEAPVFEDMTVRKLFPKSREEEDVWVSPPSFMIKRSDKKC